MSTRIRRHVGQLIIAGFAGTSIPSELRVLANEFDLGGVILFSRNIEEPEQVAELAYEVKNLSKELAAWVSVDQEGGRVARLKTPFQRVAADAGAWTKRKSEAGSAVRSGTSD